MKASLRLAISQDNLNLTNPLCNGPYPVTSRNPIKDTNSEKREKLSIRFSSNLRFRKISPKPVKVFADSARPSPQHSEKPKLSSLKIRHCPNLKNYSSATSLVNSGLNSTRTPGLSERDFSRDVSSENYLKNLGITDKTDSGPSKLTLDFLKNEPQIQSTEQKRPSWLQKVISDELTARRSSRSLKKSTACPSSRPGPRFPDLQSPSPEIQPPSSRPASTLRQVPKIKTSPLSLLIQNQEKKTARSAERDPRKITILHVTDETAPAKVLADEVSKCFELLETTATQVRGYMKKVEAILERENALHIFFSKKKKHSSLFLRIYNDMVEEMDPSSTQPNGWEGRRQNLRIIREKYQVYKRIKADLEDLTLMCKMKQVTRLENGLLKAHDEFMDRKVRFLNRLNLINQSPYIELRKKYESLNRPVPNYYEDYGDEIDKLERNYGDTFKLDNSNRVVNREFSNLFRKWTNEILALD